MDSSLFHNLFPSLSQTNPETLLVAIVMWLTSELELLPSWQLSLVETSSHDKVLSRNFFWDKETTLFPSKDRSSFKWDFSWSCMLYDCSTHTQASAECEKQCIYQFSSYFYNFLTLIKNKYTPCIDFRQIQ